MNIYPVRSGGLWSGLHAPQTLPAAPVRHPQVARLVPLESLKLLTFLNSAFRATLVHGRHHLFGTLAVNTDVRAAGSVPASISAGVPAGQAADTTTCVNLRIDPALGKVPSGLYESPDDQGPTIQSNDLDPNLPLGCRSCRILENDSQPQVPV